MNIKTPAEFAFEMDAVTASYQRGKNALKEVSLSLPRGTGLGLLGANGAGKTTAIRTLVGILRPKKGAVSVLGGKPGSLEVLKKLGFAPEDGLPPEYLTPREYLLFVGKYRGAGPKQADEIIRWFELPTKKRIGELSKGMRRRVVLAQALIGNPDFLVLDEPLNGLDPMVIIQLRERLMAYLKQGGTLLFSSHILAEIEKLCDKVAILSQGSLVCYEDADALVKEFGSVEAAFRSKVSQ